MYYLSLPRPQSYCEQVCDILEAHVLVVIFSLQGNRSSQSLCAYFASIRVYNRLGRIEFNLMDPNQLSVPLSKQICLTLTNNEIGTC